MKLVQILFTTFLLAAGSVSTAQDTLPKFSVKNLGNQNVIISWSNNYESLKQISIQRSFDSLRWYTTIMSVTDANAKMNGYADTKAPNTQMFYRLFVVEGNGNYYFTAAKRPILDTFATASNILFNNNRNINNTSFISSFYVYTNKDGYVYINLPDADRRKYRIKFYEEDDSFLFELKNIKETGLTLDKTNFLHSGWFKFELYHEDNLVEKNRFYLGKDF